MTLLWIAVGVLSILVVICLLALVDQYRTLELIRARLRLEDNPDPIALPRDRPVEPSAIGLPPALDVDAHLVVLFLSTACNTCRSIAAGLRERRPPNVWVVIEQARTSEEGTTWLADADLPLDRATVDIDGTIAAALGVSVIPSVVLYQEGQAVLAQTIPSFRQLVPLLTRKTLSTFMKFAPEGTTQI